MLYKTLVGLVLHFGMYISSPGYRSDVQLLKGMQRRATKAVKEMKDKP